MRGQRSCHWAAYSEASRLGKEETAGFEKPCWPRWHRATGGKQRAATKRDGNITQERHCRRVGSPKGRREKKAGVTGGIGRCGGTLSAPKWRGGRTSWCAGAHGAEITQAGPENARGTATVGKAGKGGAQGRGDAVGAVRPSDILWIRMRNRPLGCGTCPNNGLVVSILCSSKDETATGGGPSKA